MDVRERVFRLLEARYLVSKLHCGYDVDVLPGPDGDTILVKAGEFLEDREIQEIIDTIGSVLPVDRWFVSLGRGEDDEHVVWLYVVLKDGETGAGAD